MREHNLDKKDFQSKVSAQLPSDNLLSSWSTPPDQPPRDS
jgi:hypothetical protein